MSRLVIRNGRLVYADGTIVEGGLVCRDGRIESVFEGDGPAGEALDVGGRYVLPGVIDPHVQLYPQPDYAHYATETASAALGGVTTIVKMHRDLAGYDPESFWAEVAGAESRAHVDFSFHLALMTEAQIGRVPELARELELTSFKLFMAYKGEEGHAIGIQGVDDGLLLEALHAVAGVPGGVVLVHAENQELAARAYAQVRAAGGEGLAAFAESRPWLVEAEAVRRVAFLADVAGCPLYVVHVTSWQGLEALAAARAEGQELWIETEAHYLTETADSPAGVLAKVIPPIRGEADREALWEALESGELDALGSDHVSGASRARKSGSVWDAQLGFAGIATILPTLLDEGVNRRGLPLARVAELCSESPAQIFGLETKGALLPGKDADLVVVDLDLERRVDAAMLGSASDFSIYEGRTLRGWPVLTVSRGEIVMRDGELTGREGHGRYLRRRTPPGGNGPPTRNATGSGGARP
jgi:dihydropyrimidinase